jgi:phosphoribosylformylglycinamidine synthase subunit PurQ / glutaminase
MAQLKIGVVVFPGTNCDKDVIEALSCSVPDAHVVELWHDDVPNQPLEHTFQWVILPGGFSYGDYLRCGAMAKNSKLMQAIKRFAQSGGYVLGICNGFQILCEAGLLEGTLISNASQRFICQQRTALEVISTASPYTRRYQKGQIVEMPIAHGEGCYYADPETLTRLEANNQIVFRYVHEVNGSLHRIAGISNKTGNVMGLMPHPERNLWQKALSGFTGEGRTLFESVGASLCVTPYSA